MNLDRDVSRLNFPRGENVSIPRGFSLTFFILFFSSSSSSYIYLVLPLLRLRLKEEQQPNRANAAISILRAMGVYLSNLSIINY